MMQQIQQREILFDDSFLVFCKQVNNMVCCGCFSEHCGHEWEQLHLLCLIVQKFRFLLLATDVLELPSAY